MPRIETNRLLLCEFRETDVDRLAEYRGNPSVAQYQLWENFSLQDAKDFIEKYSQIPPGSPGEWSGFAITLKQSGEMIGDCALKAGIDQYEHAEIGFNLHPSFQGYGYATEAVRGLLDFCFRDLNIHRVIAVTDALNIKAQAVLERLEMRREAHFIQNIWFKGHWGDEYIFAILRDEWGKTFNNFLDF